MGTTLTNGVYLPNEGERNCYAGLKTNWEILDQKVADVTALQQAVAGTLHREIVESLPTTDINPNTIYMILSGTSATENVYNEFMYVNNAWELIGTSATDLTNYYTKSEVDGKLLLKANASDLTSHTGDTTIHVTTADKSTWNTVTSKANDSDVVHKSGNETIGGKKTFTNDLTIYNSDNTATTPSHILKNSKVVIGSTTNIGSQNIVFRDSADTNLSALKTSCESVGNTSFEIRVYNKDSNNQTVSGGMLISQTSANTYITPTTDNAVLFGSTSRRWSKIYGTEYYYGSNNVEFSTKFVTADTAQTVSGDKTFEGVDLKLKSVAGEYTVSSGSTSLLFYDKNLLLLSQYKLGVYGGGLSYQSFNILGYDSNNQRVSQSITFSSSYLDLSTAFLKPDTDNAIALGRSNAKWSDVQTYKVNGLNPSSLSLPSGNVSDTIDISSYITDLSGYPNNYVAPSNGFISISATGTGLNMFADGLPLGVSLNRSTSGSIKNYIPVLKGKTVKILIIASSLEYVKFTPCQGNV